MIGTFARTISIALPWTLGCATTGEVEALEARLEAAEARANAMSSIESRLARLENRLDEALSLRPVPAEEPPTLPATPRESGVHTIQVDRERVVVDGRLVANSELDNVLSDLARRSPKPSVVLAVDENVAHGDVVALMDKLRNVGISRIALKVGSY